jgi:hypothetical protein
MGKNLTLVGRRGTGLALRGGWHRILGMGMLAAGLALVVLSAAGGQSNALSPVPSVTVLHLADCRPGSPVAPVIAIAGGDWDDGECESNKEGIVTRLANWFTDDFIDGIGTSISVDGDGRTTASWSNGKDRLKIRIEGKVEFGDDDRTISNISRGGYVAIQEKRHGVKTELEIEPDGDGGFEYDYRVNGKRMTFDEAGRNWLGDVLLDVIRKTGVGAEARANRILDRDGVAGLLDEVRMVESDYVMRIFVGAALERPDLTSADCEKAELLLEVADHRSWNSSLVGDYVAVAATMSSDYETRRALSAIELDEDTSQDVIDQLLRVAARMNSDYEKSELLISLAPSCERSQRLMEM